MTPEPTPDLFNTEAMFKRPGTSSEAASSAARSARINDTHRKVYRALSWNPRTPDELARAFNACTNTIRARMSELRKAGWIEPTGETRTTDAGKPAEVMRASSKEGQP